MSLQPRAPRAPVAAARRQGGIALIVVLVLVLLVTLAGIAAVRTLVVEKRMASNSLDRSLAMQSAERVLREVEDIALAQSQATTFNTGFAVNSGYPNGTYTGAACTARAMTDPSPCTNGRCSQPTPSCTPRWDDSAFAGWAEVSVTLPTSADIATTGSDATLAEGTRQQYIIEYLGSNFVCDPTATNGSRNCAQYRVTVRTKPGTDRAAVQLQTYLVSQPLWPV